MYESLLGPQYDSLCEIPRDELDGEECKAKVRYTSREGKKERKMLSVFDYC